MRSRTSTTAGEPFPELLGALRARGLEIGVDQILRLTSLSSDLGPRVRPDELASVLAPLVAKNAGEQRIVWRVVRDLLPWVGVDVEASASGEQNAPASGEIAGAPSTARRRETEGVPAPAVSVSRPALRHRLLALAAVVALVAGGLLLWWAGGNPESRPGTDVFEPPPSKVQEGVPGPSPPVFEQPEALGEPSAPADSGRPQVSEGMEDRRFGLLRGFWILLPWLLVAVVLLARRTRGRPGPIGPRPPWLLRLRLLAPGGSPFDAGGLRRTARDLRRRAEGPGALLDLTATVAATVAAAGRVCLRFRSTTRVPEYLALVDRGSIGDHRAAYARELLRALEEEGVFVETLFFDGDPRSCDDEEGRPVSMGDLADRTGDRRLLLFTDGEALLDPWTGELMEWASLLGRWRERALLTPTPVERWGGSEIALAEKLLVAPASLEGFAGLAGQWARGRAEGASTLGGVSLLAPAVDGEPTPERLRLLEGQLDPPAWRWLCACAVHSELQWPLTMHLALLPSMGSGLLTEARLLNLMQLPWFCAGRIPAAWRVALIDALPANVTLEVRRAIVDLLEKATPPEGSVAAENRDLQLAIQQAGLATGERERRSALARLLRFSPARRARDGVALHLIRRFRSSPLDVLLPLRLREVLYREGLAARGLRSGALVVLALLASGFVALWTELQSRVAIEREPVEVARIVEGSRVEREPTGERDATIDPAPLTEPTSDDTLGEGTVAGEAEAPSVDERDAAETGGAGEEVESLGDLRIEPGDSQDRVVASRPPAEDSGVARSVRSEDLADVPRSEPAVAEPDPSREPSEEVVEPELVADPLVAPEARAPEESVESLAGAVDVESPPRGPEVRWHGDSVEVEVPFDPASWERRVQVPIEEFRAPIYYPHVIVTSKRGFLLQRPWIAVKAGFWNAARPGLVGTIELAVLDAEGGVLARDVLESPVSEGGKELDLRLLLEEEQVQESVAVRVRLSAVEDPGAFRTFVRGLLDSGDVPEQLAFQDESAVAGASTSRATWSLDGDKAQLEIPVPLETSLVHRFVYPFYAETATVERTEKRLGVSMTFANPTDHDRRAEIIVTLLDATGQVLGEEESDRGWVEEGQFGRKLSVRWRASTVDVERVARVRVEVRVASD